MSLSSGKKELSAASGSVELPGKPLGEGIVCSACLDFLNMMGIFHFKPPMGISFLFPGQRKQAESYSPEDLQENPLLADMTSAALDVLASRDRKFWLMVEAGDVDWANHDDNIDNAIGAVNSGDAAVRVITDWVEKNSNWSESLLIVTADHGHLFWLTDPSLLLSGAVAKGNQ